MLIPVRLLGLSLLSLGLLAGCVLAPVAEERSVAGGDPSPTARSAEDTPRQPVRLCERVWSEAQADSVWRCPDPVPPSAP